MCSEQCRCTGLPQADIDALWTSEEQKQKISAKHFNGSFGNFAQCVERISDRKAYFHANEAALALIRDLESEHDCGGFCEPSLFYFFKDVSEGPPKRSCKAGLKEYLTQSYFALTVYLGCLGAYQLVSFLMFFSLCCVSERRKSAKRNQQSPAKQGSAPQDAELADVTDRNADASMVNGPKDTDAGRSVKETRA